MRFQITPLSSFNDLHMHMQFFPTQQTAKGVAKHPYLHGMVQRSPAHGACDNITGSTKRIQDSPAFKTSLENIGYVIPCNTSSHERFPVRAAPLESLLSAEQDIKFLTTKPDLPILLCLRESFVAWTSLRCMVDLANFKSSDENPDQP